MKRVVIYEAANVGIEVVTSEDPADGVLNLVDAAALATVEFTQRGIDPTGMTSTFYNSVVLP